MGDARLRARGRNSCKARRLRRCCWISGLTELGFDMRLFATVAALVAASPVLAEDFLIRADVAEAVVYASGAEVLRRAELEMGPGTHRVLFPTRYFELPPVVTASSGVLGQIEALERVPIAEGALDTSSQVAARAAVLEAREAVDTAEAALEATMGALRAAELQQAYLQSIVQGGEEGVAMPEDAAALADILATLGDEMVRASQALHDARQEQAARQIDLADRQEALALEERVLIALAPFGTEVDLWAVTIEVDEPGIVTIDITDFQEEAAWAPHYDVHLSSESGALRFDRSVGIYSSEAWQDVAVTLSTADPFRRRAPSGTGRSLARIYEPQPLSRTSALAEAAPASPVIEPVVIVEDTAALAFDVDGLSLSYPYPDLVSVSPNSGVSLPFGEVAFDARLINRAVPRRDDTAFLIAAFENTSAEPILPGEARFFRDGALIGDGYVELLPQGAEWELPFGPLDHIQLSWTDLSRDSGDRGVFASSNVEDRRFRVTAENLSDERVELELLYATPFSEQEDLEIEVATSVPPDDLAWADRRGVFAWNLEVAPGASAEIDMQFEFDWPDDMVLDWRP